MRCSTSEAILKRFYMSFQHRLVTCRSEASQFGAGLGKYQPWGFVYLTVVVATVVLIVVVDGSGVLLLFCPLFCAPQVRV